MAKSSPMSDAFSNIPGVAVSGRSVEPPPPEVEAIAEPRRAPRPKPVAMRTLSVNYPEAVIRQLNVLAAEQGRTINDMCAEALNYLFTAYGKVELAPRNTNRRNGRPG